MGSGVFKAKALAQMFVLWVSVHAEIPYREDLPNRSN